MSTILFVFLVLVLGLTVGWLIGAALAFTGSRTRYDLIAGVLGAIVVAVPVHAMAPAAYGQPLSASLIGVSAAMLATWLRRIVAWKQEPLPRAAKTLSIRRRRAIDTTCSPRQRVPRSFSRAGGSPSTMPRPTRRRLAHPRDLTIWSIHRRSRAADRHRPSMTRRCSGVSISRISRAAISSSGDVSAIVGGRSAPCNTAKRACWYL